MVPAEDQFGLPLLVVFVTVGVLAGGVENATTWLAVAAILVLYFAGFRILEHRVRGDA